MKALRTQAWACSMTSFLPTACTTSTWVSTALMGAGWVLWVLRVLQLTLCSLRLCSGHE